MPETLVNEVGAALHMPGWSADHLSYRLTAIRAKEPASDSNGLGPAPTKQLLKPCNLSSTILQFIKL